MLVALITKIYQSHEIGQKINILHLRAHVHMLEFAAKWRIKLIINATRLLTVWLCLHINNIPMKNKIMLEFRFATNDQIY